MSHVWDQLNDTINELDSSEDGDREELKAKFWANAVDWWNEDMAGAVTLITGERFNIPAI